MYMYMHMYMYMFIHVGLRAIANLRLCKLFQNVFDKRQILSKSSRTFRVSVALVQVRCPPCTCTCTYLHEAKFFRTSWVNTSPDVVYKHCVSVVSVEF